MFIGLSILIVNEYAFSQPSGEWLLVDSGLTTRAVEDLSREWNVPVYAHPLETFYLGGGLMRMFSKMYPCGLVNVGSKLKLLPEGGTVPGFADELWIHTSRNTSGHLSFFRGRSGVLLVGHCDTPCDSVKRLAALRPSTVAAGHGRPLSGANVAGPLGKLASDFDIVARPQPRRYVNRPAA